MTSRQIDRIRGAVAAMALVALVIVLPVLLGVVAPLTGSGARPGLSWDGLVDVLAGPDDGSMLRLALGVLAWIGWACLAGSVLVEVTAVLRGRPTPRLPLLGAPQRAAAVLVAAVVVGLAASSRPTHPQVGGVELPVRPQLAAATTRTPLPTVPALDPTGHDGRSAPTQPHSGSRHHTHDDSLPSVRVRPHDTLWALAERHLGSGLRYREIVALNRGREQPDGRRLTDPHWIYPGWVLRLPADATGTGIGLRREPPTRTEYRTADPPPETLVVDRAPGIEAPVLGPSPASTTPDAAVSRPIHPVATAVAGVGGAAEDRASAAPVALGLGALTVAGVLAEIARQRRRQQRVRRVGERIEVPRHTARTERVLRAVPTADRTRRVEDGLALLADACRAQGSHVPGIGLVRVSADRLLLELVIDTPVAPPPFVAEGPRTWSWRGDERPRPDPDRVVPCPALVSVGVDGDDLVLVDLEVAGGLRVAGDATSIGPVLSSMTVDLLSRARRGQITLAVAEELEGAAELAGAAGVETVAGDDLPMRVRAHGADVAQVLRTDGVGDVAEAREHLVAEETWTPQVVVGRDVDAEAVPWSGSHVVSGGRGPGWVLVPAGDGRWRLDPLGAVLTASELSAPDRADLADLLRPAPRSRPPLGRIDLRDRASLEQLCDSVAEVLRDNEVPPADDVTPGGPYLRLLGPVAMTGTADHLVPDRVRRLTELMAYLALHPGAGRQDLDEALWPGQRVARTTRNPFVSRARQWLGRAPDGRPYLPLVADGGEYRLTSGFGCDWYDFVRTATTGLEARSLTDLQGALELVHGRPLQGIDPTGYVWADDDIQQMVSAVVDVAHVAAQLQLVEGDPGGAGRSAAVGLLVEPCSELLHRDVIAAAATRGDRAAVVRAVERMRSAMDSLGLDDDLLPETVELLERLGVSTLRE